MSTTHVDVFPGTVTVQPSAKLQQMMHGNGKNAVDCGEKFTFHSAAPCNPGFSCEMHTKYLAESNRVNSNSEMQVREWKTLY